MESKISDFHQTRSTLLICQRSISHHKRKLNKLFKNIVNEETARSLMEPLGIETLNFNKFPSDTRQAAEVLKVKNFCLFGCFFFLIGLCDGVHIYLHSLY